MKLTINKIYPKFKIDPLGDTINLVLACIVEKRKYTYISSEVTTGKNLYNLLLLDEVTSSQAYKRKHGQEKWHSVFNKLLKRNEKRSIKFEKMLRTERKLVSVINPCHLRIRQFPNKQKNYMLLWELVIRKKVNKIFFNSNWQYSNGCLFEYILSRELNLPAYFSKGKLSQTMARNAINQAHLWLVNKDIHDVDYEKLYTYLTLRYFN